MGHGSERRCGVRLAVSDQRQEVNHKSILSSELIQRMDMDDSAREWGALSTRPAQADGLNHFRGRT